MLAVKIVSEAPESLEFNFSIFTTPITQSRLSTYPLFGDMGKGWRLVKQLDMRIECEDNGSIIAVDDVFNMYGVGDTHKEALTDYVHSLIEFYELHKKIVLITLMRILRN